MVFLQGSLEFPIDPESKIICDKIKEIKLKNKRHITSYDLNQDKEIDMALRAYSQINTLP